MLAGETPAMNNKSPCNQASPVASGFVPEFFPVPPRGPDPFFVLCRSIFYDLERRGLLRLVRVRKPGNVRGRVLVPYRDVAELIRRLSGC